MSANPLSSQYADLTYYGYVMREPSPKSTPKAQESKTSLADTPPVVTTKESTSTESTLPPGVKNGGLATPAKLPDLKISVDRAGQEDDEWCNAHIKILQ